MLLIVHILALQLTRLGLCDERIQGAGQGQWYKRLLSYLVVQIQ